MAKKCLMEKSARLWAEKAKDAKRVAEGKKPLTKSNVRAYNRCKLCGRRHAAQVRRVPPVLPRARGERSHPGRHEGVVVKSERN